MKLLRSLQRCALSAAVFSAFAAATASAEPLTIRFGFASIGVVVGYMMDKVLATIETRLQSWRISGA
jgi:hypothetical protein